MVQIVPKATVSEKLDLQALPVGEACEHLALMRDALIRDAAKLWSAARTLSVNTTIAERAGLRQRSKVAMRHAAALELGLQALLGQPGNGAGEATCVSACKFDPLRRGIGVQL
ncbi:hypothetical protein [Bosea sp. MMO-172]|uniref:hypothetical protein n=1 Tax=Bosea sp. MMO-172 TaxID=3127885 RepID=UPI003019BCDB